MSTVGSSGITTAVPQRALLSHTPTSASTPSRAPSWPQRSSRCSAPAHAVTDMAYFAARDTSPAATCIEMVAQSDVYVGIVGVRYGSPVRDRPNLMRRSQCSSRTFSSQG